ncbi:hypothetical protein OESDEN_11740 [Oesophagostomum dentatum]|uniref:EF-hand domain-containing protein n=1 Tax=Oesophagostomum dentatum TaxID=61180 RepID=A0A0B1SU24_OESDE|nr:hypothetical protein OESDEN_11740 [Oesophagostomum dentatum]
MNSVLLAVEVFCALLIDEVHLQNSKEKERSDIRLVTTTVDASATFDEKSYGKLNLEDLLKKFQNKLGEPLGENGVFTAHKGKSNSKNGEVDYKAFAHLITTGAQDELASHNVSFKTAS